MPLKFEIEPDSEVSKTDLLSWSNFPGPNHMEQQKQQILVG